MSSSFKANPELDLRIRAACIEGLNAFRLILQRGIRIKLSQPGTGRQYLRRQRKRLRKKARNMRSAGIHVASAPGQPPAADTGDLRNSWDVGQAVVSRTEVSTPGRRMHAIRLGSRLPYARLEFGYGRARPRPYLRPVLAEAADMLPMAIEEAMNRWLP